MKHLQIPLSDTEEAVLELLKKISRLEDDKEKLEDRIKQLEYRLNEEE